MNPLEQDLEELYVTHPHLRSERELDATAGFQSKDELIEHLQKQIKEWVAERDYFEKASAVHYDLWQEEKQKVEKMQKTLEWYAGDEIAEIVRRYYLSETICEAIGQRAKVTLQSLKEDKPNETTI